mgnify:CR=1 FL=1
MCSLVHELKQEHGFDVKVCVTAQHREMLDQVLQFFEITPDYDLNIMKPNQSLNELSSRIFIAIDAILVDFAPDIVLDFDNEGKLVGIDIDRASQVVDLTHLESESLPVNSILLAN